MDTREDFQRGKVEKIVSGEDIFGHRYRESISVGKVKKIVSGEGIKKRTAR